jgi:O-antigen/teichoic acid export membrane protein
MLRNLLHTFATRILSAVCAFALVLLSTHYLGPEGRGWIGLVLTSVANVVLVNGFIGGAALVYLLPQNKNRDYFTRVLVITYGWTLIFSGVLVFFFYITDMVPLQQLVHIYILGVLASLVAAHGFILVAMEQIVLFNMTNVLQVSVHITLFTFLIFMLKTVSVYHFLYSLYAGYGVSFLFSLYHVRQSGRDLPAAAAPVPWTALLRQVSRFGFVSQLGNIVQYVNYRASYYVLHHHHSLNDIGLLDVGIRLAEAVWMISSSISTVLYSRIANLGDNDISRRLTVHLAKLSVLTVLAAVLVLSVLPVTVYTTLFGPGFEHVRDIVHMLGPGIIMFGFSTVVSHYFAGTGRYHINTWAAFIGLLITIAGNWFWVPTAGLVAAGWTASLSYVCTAFFLIALFLHMTPYRWRQLWPSWTDIRHAQDILKNRL